MGSQGPSAPLQVIATLDPLGGQATVEKIAVNAVMAGCRPEYMPVLIAAVEAIADPAFDLMRVSTTTGPNVPMLVVNGPMAKQLDISAGPNALSTSTSMLCSNRHPRYIPGIEAKPLPGAETRRLPVHQFASWC